MLFCLWSCHDDDKNYELANVAIPGMMSKVEFRLNLKLVERIIYLFSPYENQIPNEVKYAVLRFK